MKVTEGKKDVHFVAKHDSNGGLIVGALSFSLLTMATFVVKRVFRVLKRRKDRSMNYRSHNSSDFVSGNASAAAPALDRQEKAESTHLTAPASGEKRSSWTVFASEAVLRRDWDSPEEDEAWAHL